MKMTKDERLLFCGTSYGNIIIFNVDGVNLIKNMILYNHSNSITSISISENLNMFETSSYDGFIHIYIPSFAMVRSLRISKKVKSSIKNSNYEELKKEEYLYAEHIYLFYQVIFYLVLQFIINKKSF